MSEQNSTQASIAETTEVETTEERVFEDLTPYEAAMIVNAMLVKAGVKNVKFTSQGLYGRASKQLATFGSYRLLEDGTRDETLKEGKWYVDGAKFAAWAKRTVQRYVSGSATSERKDYAAMAKNYEI